MKRPQTRGFSWSRVERPLSKAQRYRSIGDRIDILSRDFLGYPYKSNPLIGAADTTEVFTASLDGFDCVTFIETVLALACALTAEDFIEWLRKIRYEQGIVRWERRNHYMTLWIRNNRREGIIRPISMPAVPAVSRERVLNVVPGIAARRTRVRCVPKRAVPRLAACLTTGDLMFFVSTRRNLDVFHAGIIARDGDRVLMRHASRSQGAVVEQELSEFLKANRMAGVIVMRPREVTRRKAVSK